MASSDDPSIVEGTTFKNTPEWWSTVTEAGGIYRYVLLVIVSAILGFLGAVVQLFADTMYWLFVWPTRTLFGAIAGVGRPFWMLLGWVEGFQTSIEAAASSAGLAGPVAGLVAWLVPALILVGIINVLLGLAETYLPLSAIPILGRWFR